MTSVNFVTDNYEDTVSMNTGLTLLVVLGQPRFEETKT